MTGRTLHAADDGLRRWIIVAIAVLALVAAACGNGGSAEPGDEPGDADPDEAAESEGESVQLQAGHVLAESEAHHEIILEVAERVAERTDGRVTIEVFPSSQLGSEGEVFEQASVGATVMAWGGTDRVSEFAVPDISILLGPYVMDDPLNGFQDFADTDIMSGWVEQVADEAGLRILAMNWYFGDRHIIANSAFEDPDDLRNVAVRVPPSPVFSTIFQTLGSTPVTLEWAEVYTGLSQGVIDAAEAPLSTLYGSSLYEVADTVTLTGHINSSVGWTMSEEVFQRLSAADQEILVEEVRRGGEQARDAFVDSEAEYRELLEAEGVTIVEVDTDAFQEATLGFYDRFPDWSDGLYDDVRAALDS